MYYNYKPKNKGLLNIQFMFGALIFTIGTFLIGVFFIKNSAFYVDKIIKKNDEMIYYNSFIHVQKVAVKYDGSVNKSFVKVVDKCDEKSKKEIRYVLNLPITKYFFIKYKKDIIITTTEQKDKNTKVANTDYGKFYITKENNQNSYSRINNKKEGETITINGETYNVMYIDKNGDYTVLSKEGSSCKDSVLSTSQSAVSLPFYARDGKYSLYTFTLLIW